mmetsp:Transcript_1212/g.2093  ORF Transcript_1212/g.2093 Transcript_1212/m.2093 type:complete len:227 (+) Transcript_1212:1475-2155(+)
MYVWYGFTHLFKDGPILLIFGSNGNQRIRRIYPCRRNATLQCSTFHDQRRLLPLCVVNDFVYIVEVVIDILHRFDLLLHLRHLRSHLFLFTRDPDIAESSTHQECGNDADDGGDPHGESRLRYRIRIARGRIQSATHVGKTEFSQIYLCGSYLRPRLSYVDPRCVVALACTPKIEQRIPWILSIAIWCKSNAPSDAIEIQIEQPRHDDIPIPPVPRRCCHQCHDQS